MGELWDERADWWSGFHFRQGQVPDKRHVSELEWQLTQHKAEAARWLLGKGTVSTSFLLSLSVFLLKNNSSIIGNSWQAFQTDCLGTSLLCLANVKRPLTLSPVLTKV